MPQLQLRACWRAIGTSKVCSSHVVFVAVILLSLANAWGTPPQPTQYREIPDLADDAKRELRIAAEDRGPVWLLTGFLDGWSKEMPLALVDRLHPTHWRVGDWPFWFPRNIALTRPQPQWNDDRADATTWAGWLNAVNKYRTQGLTCQLLVSHHGPYYGVNRLQNDELAAWADHLRIVLKYARHMGLPCDYLEIWNEPAAGPYTGVASYGYWRGEWTEFLAAWDTAYDVIREVWPDAKIVGPSYPHCTAATLEPFLAHCASKRQILDVLSWHEITQQEIVAGQNYDGEAIVAPDKAHKNVQEIRALVANKYPQLRIKEIHIDEWGFTIDRTGPGTQMAFFYYLDQAGIDRAARAHWTERDLDGLIFAQPDTPRASYWCWSEYAKQSGGVRLLTETNDRNLVALASRHDASKTIRILVARSKHDTGNDFAKQRPPISAILTIEGIPLTTADVSILKLGPAGGALTEKELSRLTASYPNKKIANHRLELSLKDFAENEVRSITIAPPGSLAKEQQAAGRKMKQLELSQSLSEGKPLPQLLFKEDFEHHFQPAMSVAGAGEWSRPDNSACNVVIDANQPHGGKYCARFNGTYWTNHDIYHAINATSAEIIEVSGWFRFPDFDGNKDGRGLSGIQIGLYESPNVDVDRNYASFCFGTRGQTGSSCAIFNNEGRRLVDFKQPSALTSDVRGRWVQVSLVLNAPAQSMICRYRTDARQKWQTFYEGDIGTKDWTPKYAGISAYNQPPDWRFTVDDIEVRADSQ